ncbi:MAG TPA: periplasmic heavy metal sensor [Terriglobia bacterium]|nr:periplasmic heavy metal sensor [Terriglobia bacterium]
MKSIWTLIATAMLLLPFAAWAQDNPQQVVGAAPIQTAGPVIAGQAQPGAPPPPRVLIQKRITTGGPGNAMYMPMMGPGFGDGLGAWWKNSEIVSKLQLSDDQVRKVSQTFLDHKLKLVDLQADLEKQELRLEPLMDVDQPDTTKVGAQIDLITAARGRLEKENAMMMLAIRSQLTVEQWKKLKSLQPPDPGKDKVFFYRSVPGGPEALPPLPPPESMPAPAPIPPR